MTETKKKRKKHKRRSRKQRIADMERKLAEEKAKIALEGLLTAVKEERVAEDDVAEYKKALRHLKLVEKAPGVLSEYGLEDEATAVAKLRDKIINKLKGMIEDGGDDEEEDEIDDEDSDEEEDDSDEEDDEEEDEDEDLDDEEDDDD